MTDAPLLNTLAEISRTLQRMSNRLDKMEEARELELQETFRRALYEMAGLKALLERRSKQDDERFERIDLRLTQLEAR